MPKGAPGKVKSAKHRKNISLALTGKKKSEQHRKNLSGPKSDEHKKNISIAALRPERNAKFRKTSLDNNCYSHPSKDPIRNNLLIEYWLNKGFSREEAVQTIYNHQKRAASMIINHKSHWTVSFWLEKGFSREEAKNKISEIQLKNALKANITKSKEATCFLDRLEIVIGFNIEREVLLLNRFKVDGFIRDKNIVIEYFGSFWHMHPSLFEEHTIHRVTGWKASSKWAEDAGRIKFLKKNNYKVIQVWDIDSEDKFNDIAAEIKGE